MILADENGPAYAALMWLKRFAWLSIYNDVVESSGQGIGNSCLDLLKTQRNNINNSHEIAAVPMPEEILIESSRILHADCQASLIQILKQIETPSNDQLTSLKAKVSEIIDLMKFCVSQKHPSLAKLREFCYTSICDLLQYYGHTLTEPQETDTWERSLLKVLIIDADCGLTNELIAFVKDRCLENLENEDQRLMKESMRNDDEVAAKIEAVHRRRQLLAGFCKLIVFRRIDMRFAAPILGHYMRSQNDYGDVIKHTISKCREQNQIELSKALIISLVKVSWNGIYFLSFL